MLVVLFFVANLNFVIFEYIPLGIFKLPPNFFAPCKGLSCENAAIYTHVINEFGLNKPWPFRYETYLIAMFTGHFGNCISATCGNLPVWTIIATFAPNSIFILSVSIIIATLIGAYLGVVSASRRGKFIDLSSLSIGLFAFSVPSFWLGLLMIYFFEERYHWFPIGLGNATVSTAVGSFSYWLAYLHAAALPIVLLTVISYGFFLLIMRNTMYDILDDDYILMARAKGLSERKVLYKHGFRNALLPVVTGIALSFGGILGGAVITETIFDFPGIGYKLLQYIFAGDFTTLQGIFFIIAVMTVLANFISDIAYGLLDPRITY